MGSTSLLELVESIGMSVDFVFRGQKRSHTKLTTSLERHRDNDTSLKYKAQNEIGVDYQSLPSLEHQIVNQFSIPFMTFRCTRIVGLPEIEFSTYSTSVKHGDGHIYYEVSAYSEF